MGKTFILLDSQNLFHRQINMAPASPIDEVVGLSLHMILTSMKKEFTTFNADHAVVFLDGHSWRKDVYPEYKLNRKLLYAQKTDKEKEEHQVLQEAFDDFIQYLIDKTNITVIKNPSAEADDMISIFVESHPNDKHILISSDSDFIQLLRYDNFTLYDPIKDIQIKREGVFNDNSKRLAFTINASAKIKVGEVDELFVPEDKWYEYALFLKCIRGDKSDNIFSAYPGVREKGTKTTIGIREAYNDINKGYAWNNFMMQRYMHHSGVEKRVKEAYEFNKDLIDLTLIPNHIKEKSLEIIKEATSTKNVPSLEVGMAFMKYVGKCGLQKIGNNSKDFMPLLNSKYN